MPMPDALNPPPALDDLLRRLATLRGDPGRDLDDFARISERARLADLTGELPPTVTELRVRLAGVGVDGNHVPVHHASQILDLIQGSVTAIASAARKRDRVTAPKDGRGRRVGIREATELRIGPETAPGSLVFHLSSSPHLISDSEEVLPGTEASDGLVDVAVRRFFDVVGLAQGDKAEDIGVLSESIRRDGSIVASKLAQLADRALAAEVDLDLGHLSQSGRRSTAQLGSRGALALRAAAERNKRRTEAEELTGVLRTVSDGADQLRLHRDDDKEVRIAVDPEIGVSLGPLLGKKVVIQVEAEVRWNLTSGKETRTRHLISAALAPEIQTLPEA